MSDCIWIQGSALMEAHPVGSRWALKARERGAKIIHVDPHFSRTSALADTHVPIRAGSDIAFLGGLIRHIIETGTYDRSTWMFEGGDVDTSAGDDEQSTQAFTDRTAPGIDPHEIPRDPTLQHPRCVFQVLRRHY